MNVHVQFSTYAYCTEVITIGATQPYSIQLTVRIRPGKNVLALAAKFGR